MEKKKKEFSSGEMSVDMFSKKKIERRKEITQMLKEVIPIKTIMLKMGHYKHPESLTALYLDNNTNVKLVQ